jgi:hypothetical protein
MTTATFGRKALGLAATLLLLSSSLVYAGETQEPVGHLTIVGKVLVNGQPATTGDVIASGGTIQTAKGASAVVSLGKLGRVEVLPDTKMVLRFAETSVDAMLDAGRVRLSSSTGVTATVGCRN